MDAWQRGNIKDSDEMSGIEAVLLATLAAVSFIILISVLIGYPGNLFMSSVEN